MSRWHPCCCDKEEKAEYGILVKHVQNLSPVVPNDFFPGFYQELPTINYFFYYFKGFPAETGLTGITGMTGISKTEVQNYWEVPNFGIWSDLKFLGQVKDEFIQSGIDTSRSILNPPTNPVLDDINVSYTIFLPKEWEGTTVQEIIPWANILKPFDSSRADKCYSTFNTDCNLFSTVLPNNRYTLYDGGSNIKTNKFISVGGITAVFFTTFHEFKNELYLTRDPLGYITPQEIGGPGGNPVNIRNYNWRIVTGYKPDACSYILQGNCCNGGVDVNCKNWTTFLVEPKINEKTVVYYSTGITELNKVEGSVVGNIVSSVDIKYLNRLLPLLNRFRIWNKWWYKDPSSCTNNLVEYPESYVQCKELSTPSSLCNVGAITSYANRVIDFSNFYATVTGKITGTDFNFSTDPNRLEVYSIKICKGSYTDDEGNIKSILNVLDVKRISDIPSEIIQKNKISKSDYFFEDTTNEITHTLSRTQDAGTVSYPGQVDSCCADLSSATVLFKWCAVTQTRQIIKEPNCDDDNYWLEESFTTTQSIAGDGECSELNVMEVTSEIESCCSYDDVANGRNKCGECIYGRCYKHKIITETTAVEVGRSYSGDFGSCDDFTSIFGCQCSSSEGPCCLCNFDPGCQCGTNGCPSDCSSFFVPNCLSTRPNNTCNCNCTEELILGPSDDIDAALALKDERIQYPVKFVHTNSPVALNRTLIITDKYGITFDVVNPPSLNSQDFHREYYLNYNNILRQTSGTTLKLEKYIVSKDFKIFSFIYSRTTNSTGDKTFFITSTPLLTPIRLNFNVSETKWKRLNEYSKAAYKCHQGISGCTGYFDLFGCTGTEQILVAQDFRSLCTSLVNFYGITSDGRTLDPLGMTGINFNQFPLPITKISALTDSKNWCISKYF